MSRLPRIAATLGAALACAPSPARAAAPIQIAWRPATTANYTPANRPRSAVTTIVVHSTEGGYFGSIQWLRNPKAQASAHYVVSRGGEIAQLVRNGDIAWHAGNWLVNRQSIGIEHEGYSNVRGSFTEAEYRASARLSGWLARSYLLPIDRRHFIGHANVPDPNHPGQWGGFAHHMDPGPYWDWSRYLAYVRTYARGGRPPVTHAPAPAPSPVRPTRTKPTVIRPNGEPPAIGPVFAFAGLRAGTGLSGFVPWRADVAGSGVGKVDFLVDGVLRWTAKRAPYRYGGAGGMFDTTQIPNGPHVLAIRVTTTKGKVTGSSVRVGIANTPFQVAAVAPANGQELKGRAHLVAAASGGAADRIEFVVDGRVHRTDSSAPYEDDWDTSKESNGAHTLLLRGVAKDGRVATATVGVVVANAAPAPPPTPTGSISIRSQSLRDGQTLAGAVRWSADVRGRDVERVEFWIDGVLRWTVTGSPYSYDGDSGRWDTRAETNAQHVLTVRAVARSGAEAKATVVVAVANQVAAPLSVQAPLPDGATVTGVVHVVAPVEGKPGRVEFRVDGTLRRTEYSSPYEFDWDTTKETAGQHTLAVTAVAGERTATSTQTLTVASPLPPALTVSLPLKEGQTVSGTTRLAISTTGTPDRVELWIDGVRRATDTSSPYAFSWDTTREAGGDHAVAVKAFAGAATVEAAATVTVANAPAPTPAALAVTLPLTDGQSVSGSLHVVAAVTGAAGRVEFWVDGSLRHTERTAPYEFDWDTTKTADGSHTLLARAYADGRSVSASATVKVANAVPEPTPTPGPAPTPAPTPTPTSTPVPAPAFAVASSLSDGGTVSGTVRVTATVTGEARRVEIWIDDRRRAVAYAAPWEFDWNTTRSANGTHRVVLRARARDGTVVEVAASVVVANTP